MDSGDKATNKAMSIAFKYACFQVFCIPTEEMVDPDKESHEVTPAKISEKDAKILEELLIKKGVNVEKTMELYKVKSLTELTPAMYSDIIGKANGAKR